MDIAILVKLATFMMAMTTCVVSMPVRRTSDDDEMNVVRQLSESTYATSLIMQMVNCIVCIYTSKVPLFSML